MFSRIRSLFQRGPTVGDVVGEYLNSQEFRCLKPISQEVYANALNRWIADEKLRNCPIASIARKDIEATLAPLSQGAANFMFKRVRVLMRFAQARGYRQDDGCNGIKAKPINKPHHSWTDDELAQYCAHHALGTRPRLALELAISLGQRRGDIARMRWADIKDGRIEVKQGKTGAELSILIHPDLQAALDLVPAEERGETIICRAGRPKGKPLTVESFGNLFAEWIEEAGLPERCVLHGLRHATGRCLAEGGGTEKQIAAVTGHKTLGMVARYTKAASQSKLADQAIALMTRKKKLEPV